MGAVVSFVLVVASTPAPADESFGLSENVLHVSRYTSLSGDFQLVVDPTHLNACYQAHYTVYRQGGVIWSKQLPFTLWKARITDDGYVVGYAYTQGVDGIFGRGNDPRPGHMVVAIVDPNGNITLQEKHKRTESQFLHAAPSPLAADIELDGNQESFLLRIENTNLNNREEHWWYYDIRGARRTKELDTAFCLSDGYNSRSILHVRSVPATELWLVQMWTYQNRKSGAAFFVCDSSGSKIWELEALGDYEVSDEVVEDTLREQIWRSGAIVPEKQPKQFTLQLVKTSEKVTFLVEKTANPEWQVSEVNRWRSVYPIGRDLSAISNLTLSATGEVDLRAEQTGGVYHPVHDVACGFDVDAQGSFGFIRHKDDTYKFVSVDSDGKLLTEFEMALEIPSDFQLDGIANVGAGHFVTTASSMGVGSRALAWNIDVKAKSVDPLSNFQSPGIDCLAGMNNGRFVVLATNRGKYTMSSQLQICDSTGERLELIEEEYESYPHKLFSPAAVTINSVGEICVLDVIRKEVVIYGDDGRYRRTLELERLWGREPSYPSGIAGTNDGGILVHDFDGRFPLVQMTLGGKVTREIDPRPAEGRKTLYGGRNVRVAPDGRLWLMDGSQIVRLGQDGIVDKRLGIPVAPQVLGRIGAIHVDRAGRFYAQSSQTGAVHIFDATGHRQRIVHHERLLDLGYSQRPINLTDDGELVVSDGDLNRETLLFFDEGGELVDTLLPPAGPVFYQPVQDKFLCSDYTQLLVASRDGSVQHRIRRHADRTWLEHLHSVAVASDGSFAVLTSHSDPMVSSKVSIYECDYTPRCTMESDRYASLLDYDGSFLVINSKHGLLLFDANGTQLGMVKPDSDTTDSTWLFPYLVRERRELVLIEQSDEPIIRRYNLATLYDRGTD